MSSGPTIQTSETVTTFTPTTITTTLEAKVMSTLVEDTDTTTNTLLPSTTGKLPLAYV